MPTSQPFAYNVGPSIPGTIQSGDFAIGTPTSGFTNSPQFWNGPDEDLGYIIAQPVPSGDQPNPVGLPAYLGFFRTDGFSDIEFINLTSSIAGQSFSNILDAYNWLNSNGYYTNFNPITPTPTITPSITPTITPSITPTQTPTQTPTPSVTSTVTPSITPSITPTITPTITLTPSITPTITPSITPTRTLTPTPTNINVQGFSYPNFASTTGLVGVGNTSVSSNIYYLTTATTGQVGNVYRTTAIQYNRNFSTTWSTFIGGGTGADGYCIQWTPTNNTNGPAGGGVGLLNTAINAITFLTFTNNNYAWYKNGVSQGVTSVTSGFWRQTLYFWGDYNHSAQTFALYWNTTNSKPGSPNQTFNSFSFDTGSYYMGFGAATGGSTDNHELLSWNLQFT